MSFLAKISHLSLRIKFIGIITMLIVSSGTLVSAYLISQHINTAKQGLVNKGSALIKVLAANCEYGTYIENETVLNELIAATVQTEDIIYIVVENIDGKILASEAKDSIIIPEGHIHVANRDSLHILKINESGDESGYYQLCYPVVTTQTIISRESLGSIGRSQGHVVTEIIGMVRIGLSLSGTDAQARANMQAAIIIILLVMGITILLSLGFVKAVVKPIETLAKAAEKIAHGDLSQQIGIDRTDEIGKLAGSFDSMVVSLKNSRKEIEEYNRTLEEKIIDRTKELEEAQSQLIHSEKMAAIGQLSAGVAHELNNPLGGILGYAQYTLEKMNRKPFEEISEKEFDSYKKHLRDIEDQARRCKTIVQNLLKFSRATSKIDLAETDINAALLETISLVEHQLSMHRINLVTDFQEGLPITMANVGMLQQVFTNIIINALHAMQGGGNMIIASRYSPELGEFSGVIEISITDDGCGIPEEIQNNIFEPFFTTKGIGKGTGLGLSVSYGIIKEHGGEIKVESVEDCGTTFTIILPIEKSAPGADNNVETQKDITSEQDRL